MRDHGTPGRGRAFFCIRVSCEAPKFISHCNGALLRACSAFMNQPRIFITAILIAAASAFAAGSTPSSETDKDLAELKLAVQKNEVRLKETPRSAEAARKLATSINELSVYLAKRGQAGDFAKALELLTSSIDLREQLVKSHPAEPWAAHEASVNLNELGGLLVRQGQPGDLDKAFAHFTRSLELTEAAVKARPESKQAQRDVAVSSERLGVFLTRRGAEGDLEKAFTHLSRCVTISESLQKTEPDSADAMRDLAAALERLGTFLFEREDEGDSTAALANFTRSLELREAVLKKSPDSQDASREVSIGLEKLADFLIEYGGESDSEKILANLNRSLELREVLMKANPLSAQAARDLSVALNKLGDYLATLGKPEDAIKALGHFERDLSISEKLLTANPNSAQAARDVVISHYKLANFCRSTGNKAGEEKHFRACYDLLKVCAEKKLTFDQRVVELFEDLKEHFKGE